METNALPLMNPQEKKDFEEFIGGPLSNEDAQVLRHDITIWKMFDAWIEKKKGTFN